MDEQQIIADARAWYRDSWDPDLTVGEWFRLMYESGWGYPTWPRAVGRQGPVDVGRQARARRASRRRRPGPAVGHRADAARADAVPPRQRRAVRPLPARPGLRRRDHVPDAVRARRRLRPRRRRGRAAVRDGDEWRITGTKVWTSNAKIVTYGMLLARTNWEVPKHRGLSFFLCPAQQPGVEARPIKQMNGRAEFNLVHFDDAIVADARPARRRGRGLGRHPHVPHVREELVQPGGPRGRTVRPGRPDDAGRCSSSTRWSAARPRRRVATAASGGSSTASSPSSTAPAIRTCARTSPCCTPAGRSSATRTCACAARRCPASRGRSPRSRCRTSPAVQRELGLQVQGAVRDAGRRRRAVRRRSRTSRCRSPATSIAGGTDEIQRNHLAEKVLGLPREPGTEQDQPFSEIAHGAAAWR